MVSCFGVHVYTYTYCENMSYFALSNNLDDRHNLQSKNQGLCTVSQEESFSCHLIDGAMNIKVTGDLEDAIENFYNITRSILNDDSIPQSLEQLRKIHYMKPLSVSIVTEDPRSIPNLSALTIAISVCAIIAASLFFFVWRYSSQSKPKTRIVAEGQLGIASRSNFESIWLEGLSDSSVESLSTIFPSLVESCPRSDISSCSTVSDLSAPLERIVEEGNIVALPQGTGAGSEVHEI